ncbi:MAG: DUF3726 domain-containing protein [Thalassobaculaceae bacterium]
MRRTLSEIRAVCIRAARGAGCPWGLAEEAGIAARVLEAHGLPGVAALSRLFERRSGCACHRDPETPSCGLWEMAALSDDLPDTGRRLGPVSAPLLLVVPCLLDARSGGGWRIDWEDGAIVCGPGGVAREGGLFPDKVASVSVTRAAPPAESVPPDWRSRDVPDAAWCHLEALAARTYVPETAASRISGAGPGTADTD